MIKRILSKLAYIMQVRKVQAMRKKSVRCAGVFFNGDFFCIYALSGCGILYAEPDAPPHYLTPDVDDMTLGYTLRLALQASKDVLPSEFDKLWKSGVLQQRAKERDVWEMQQYGYKTRRALWRGRDKCRIRVYEGEIKIFPSHHYSLDCYSARADTGPFPLCIPETATDAELGMALREGFERCTGSYYRHLPASARSKS